MADFMRDWGPLGDDEANRNTIEELRQVLHGKQTIAFVGAGAAAERIPTWGEFIIRIIARLHRVLDTTQLKEKCQLWLKRDPLNAANILSETVERDVLLNALFSEIDSAMGMGKTTAIYQCLAHLPLRVRNHEL